MRILLISPRWSGYGSRRKIKVHEREVHPLTLGIIAALCGDHDVRIVNEHTQRIPFDEPWDLVGLTCTTYVAPRAYQIAADFRARGVPVVMGGVHPNLMPEECLQNCDAVVRGEVELVWQDVLRDAERGELAPTYDGQVVTDMSLIPNPRRDLYSSPRQPAAYFQATRGCGRTCEFCYLQYVGWGPHRKRPIDRVIAEMRTIPQRFVIIVDDNLFVDRDYAMELFREMIPLKKFWWAQTPVTACLDEELLEAAYRSGCFAVCVGFQSINRASLEQADIVKNRVEHYCEAVRNLHRHRILVDGSFIFGFDPDPPTIFRDTIEAIRDMKLDNQTLYTLTPYPGTPYFKQLEQEGRIIDRDWSHFDWDHVVLQPKGMTAEELDRGMDWAFKEVNVGGFRWMMQRIMRNSWVLARSPRLAAFLLHQNFPQRRNVDY